MAVNRKKLAVIGASHFQLPLILKAQEKGCEVHAFAWECGDVGESAADVFHPVSITEVERIAEECRRVGIDGICTIASDLATLAVNHTAQALGLVGNSPECTHVSTDKAAMRRAFAEAGDPSPRSVAVSAGDADSFDPAQEGLRYPLIVKPTDRSGSRGVTKLEGSDPHALRSALHDALQQGFAGQAVVEEFVSGDEFSVEGISWKGEHRILAITRKGTTGAPHFIETSHLQPAGIDEPTSARVRQVVAHALGTLGIRYGASHSELKIDHDGSIRIIEIGARMGGDCIGSHLVQLSTGIDFVGAVVDVALGIEPDLAPCHKPAAAAVRFLFGEADRRALDQLRIDHPDFVRYVHLDEEALRKAQAGSHHITDSSTRLGHFVMSAPGVADLAPYLPAELEGGMAN